jgi:hypothetical protein
MQVAIRCVIEDTGSDYTGTPRFGLGLCSGGTNIIGDLTTTHFVGAVTNDATWARSVSGATLYTINPVVAATKVGTTLTTGGSLSTAFVLQAAYEKLTVLRLTKGSPNWTLQLTMESNAVSNNALGAIPVDYVGAHTVPPPNVGHAANATTVAIAVDEGANGTLDHVCVWWDPAERLDVFQVEACPLIFT